MSEQKFATLAEVKQDLPDHQKRKEGEPRATGLNDDLRTLRVLHKEFGGDVMVIDAGTFDAKIHTLCNEDGQVVNDKGHVVEQKQKQDDKK
jgi:hypothetical protein